MKKQILFALFAVLVALGTGCKRIDAGHVGIQIKKSGSEKGVQEVAAVTGRVTYNPINYEIIEWPTFVQTKNYTLRVTDRDGMSVGLSVALDYSTPAGSAPDIYVKYRKGLKELEDGAIKTIVSKSVSTVAGAYKSNEMYGNRAGFQKELEDSVVKAMTAEGFEVGRFALSGEIDLPPSIKQSIDLTVKADQDALRKQQEIAQTKAEEEKRRATAQGMADAERIASEGRLAAAENDAKANRVLSASITNTLLRYKELEVKDRKWDGKYPSTLVGDKAASILLSTGGN